MSKLGTLTLTGKSGDNYEFNAYPIGTEFKPLGAVYYISKRAPKTDGSGTHTQIYIGQTGDLSCRFNDHHKAADFKKNGANCICIHVDENEGSRLRKEKDLISAYDPPCNG